jgi:hypothetical protein
MVLLRTGDDFMLDEYASMNEQSIISILVSRRLRRSIDTCSVEIQPHNTMSILAYSGKETLHIHRSHYHLSTQPYQLDSAPRHPTVPLVSASYTMALPQHHLLIFMPCYLGISVEREE